MSKGPFLASEFVATKFSSAAEKAEFGNALLRFVESGFARNLFTDRLYGRLSNCFGHIAPYVEGAVMRSFDTKTAWTGFSDAKSLRIIPCSEP